MKQPAVVALVLALVTAVGACGEPNPLDGPEGSSTGDSSASYDGTWRLVEGHGPESGVAIIKGYRITLDITGDTVSGTSACNSYGGDIKITGDSFALRSGGMTEMACKPDVMDAETAYLAALQAADKIARDGDHLSLTGENTELSFELVPPVPTANLIETRWELESLIYGTGPDGIVTSAEPASLMLNRDGTITGSTGCRELHGEWVENGDEINFTTFGATGGCPKELREQDGHVVTVLGDGFVPSIEEDQLTLISQGDIGLMYKAAG